MSSALRVPAFSAPEGHAPAEIPGVVLASRLGVRPQPRTIPTGIAQVDELTGGIPCGGLTEICGPASSGRTSLLLSLMAQVTGCEALCALVDASDAFNPHSAAAAAGVELKRVLWVRCGEHPPQRHRGTENREIGTSGRVMDSITQSPDHPITRFSVSRNLRGTSARVEQALRAADLLLEAGGFGLVALDLGDIPYAIARRVPLTSWFRFRRAVENTATALIVLEQEASAKSCASLVLRTKQSAINTQQSATDAVPTHARLLREMRLEVEVLNSRVLQRRPVRSATSAFTAQAAWSDDF